MLLCSINVIKTVVLMINNAFYYIQVTLHTFLILIILEMATYILIIQM